MREVEEIKTIRMILEEELRTFQGRPGYLPAHDAGFISEMLVFPETDEEFFGVLQREPEGSKMLEALLRLCSAESLGVLLPKVRCWAEVDNTRRGFLDIADRWERVLRYGVEQEDIA